MSNYSVKWDILQLKCGNCGADLHVVDGQFGCFYSCVKYPTCFNRVNIEIYEKILKYLTGLLSEGPDINYTSHKWVYRTGYQHYWFKILKHKTDRFIVEVINIKKTRLKA